MGHFGDVLPSQSLGLDFSTEKLKQTQQKQTRIRNKIESLLQHKMNQKTKSGLVAYAPPATSGLETEQVYPGRSR